MDIKINVIASSELYFKLSRFPKQKANEIIKNMSKKAKQSKTKQTKGEKLQKGIN